MITVYVSPLDYHVQTVLVVVKILCFLVKNLDFSDSERSDEEAIYFTLILFEFFFFVEILDQMESRRSFDVGRKSVLDGTIYTWNSCIFPV